MIPASMARPGPSRRSARPLASFARPGLGLFAAFALATLTSLGGCAQSGASPGGDDHNRKPPAEQNQETEQPGDTATTTVTTELAKAYSPAPITCIAPEVLAAPKPLTGQKVIDGEVADWDLTSVLMTDPVGDSHGDGDLLSVRAEHSENHLWLLVELSPSASADLIRLNFGRLQVGTDQILHNSSFDMIEIAGARVSHISESGTATALEGSQVMRKGQVIEAKIPTGTIKFTLATAGWWWQVGYFSTAQRGPDGEPLLLDMMARRYFRSLLPDAKPAWFFESCRIAEQASAPRLWLVRNFADRDAAYLTKVQVARHGAAVATASATATKRLDDLTFIAVRDVAGQEHRDNPKMANFAVIPLMSKALSHPALKKQQFEKVTAALTRFYLRQSHSQFSAWPLAPLVEQVLTTSSQCEVLGIEHYLSRFASVSHQPAGPFQDVAQIFLASFPVDSLYRFVEGLSATEDLAAITAAAFKTRLGASQVAGHLCQKLPRLTQVTMADIWPGWLEKDQPYHQRFHPEKLLDRDGDSLPEVWEDHLRLNSQSFDSDKDGFSDLTELVAATSPQDDLSYPGHLIIDREFSDWHKLIGSQVVTDRDPATSQCASSLDLLFSGAIFQHPRLQLAFQYSPIGHDFPYYFEVRLRFADTPHPFIAVLRHDTPGYVLKNATTGEALYREPFGRFCGQRACDLSLPLSPLGISADGAAPHRPLSVQIKAYKLGAQPQLCDESSFAATLFR